MGLLKKIFKPVSKVLDKIIPNEIKPALPYLAAFAPYMGGMQGIMGSGMMQRALMSGGLNIGAQLAQEGSEGDINLLSAGLGALQGAMTAPGTPGIGGTTLPGQATPGATPGAAQFFREKAIGMDPGWMKSGTEILGKGSKYLTGVGKTLTDNPFSVEGLKAATIPLTQGTGDLMYAQGQRDLKDLANEVVEDMGGGYSDDAYRAAIRKSMEAYGATEEEILESIIAAGYRSGGRVGLAFGGIGGAIDNVKRNEMAEYYKTFGKDRFLSEMFDEFGNVIGEGEQFFDRVDEQVATGKFPEPEKFKGWFKDYEDLEDKFAKTEDRYENYEDKLDEKDIDKIKYYEDKMEKLEKRADAVERRDTGTLLDNLDASEITRTPDFQAWLKLFEAKDPRAQSHPYHDQFEMVLYSILPGRDKTYVEATNYEHLRKNGGRINKAEGGVPSVLPKGVEADYRGGGFIPIGSKERADDVPARLSENEFVMTADAVRAAGGGNVNKGAQRMYNVMNNLEARA